MAVEGTISGARSHPRPIRSPYSTRYGPSGSETVGRTGTQRVLPLIVGLALALAGCTAGDGTPTALPSVGGSPTASVTQASAETSASPSRAAPSTAVVLGGRLLFSRSNQATHTFVGSFVSRPDGSGETEIPLPWTEGANRWSRSGKEIAVATELADKRVGTAIIAPDGTVLRVLEISDPTLNLACWVWSIDDARLACEAWDDADPSRRGIYSVRASDGGDLQRVSSGANDLPGDYSPTGQFVFKRGTPDEGPGQLMLVDASGGEPRLLAAGSYGDPGRFAPDGASVLTSADARLVIMDLDGKVLQRITAWGDSFALFGPVWSPDGTRIAFSRAVGGGPFSDIWTSLPDGTHPRQVTRTPKPVDEIGVDWGVGGG